MSVIYLDTNLIVGALRQERERKQLIRLGNEHQLMTSLNLGECFKDSNDQMKKGKALKREKKRVSQLLHASQIAVCNPACFFGFNQNYEGSSLHLCSSRCYKRGCFRLSYTFVEKIYQEEDFRASERRWSNFEEFKNDVLEAVHPAFKENIATARAITYQSELAYEIMYTRMNYDKKMKDRTLRNHWIDLLGSLFLGYIDYLTVDSKQVAPITKCWNRHKKDSITQTIILSDIESIPWN